jgi:hypothetical protein
MTDLSPAAQQVFWEFNRAASGKPDDWHYLPAIAAALRAAADQVVPLYACSLGSTRGTTRLGVRQRFLAIAAELESF